MDINEYRAQYPYSVPEYIDEDGNVYDESDINDMYADMLDEVYGTVKVAGMEYDTSRAPAKLDPIAYRCGMLDWINSNGWDEWTEDHEWNVPDEDEDEDEWAEDREWITPEIA